MFELCQYRGFEIKAAKSFLAIFTSLNKIHILNFVDRYTYIFIDLGPVRYNLYLEILPIATKCNRYTNQLTLHNKTLVIIWPVLVKF